MPSSAAACIRYGIECDLSAGWSREPWMARIDYTRFREGASYNGARKREARDWCPRPESNRYAASRLSGGF